MLENTTNLINVISDLLEIIALIAVCAYLSAMILAWMLTDIFRGGGK